MRYCGRASFLWLQVLTPPLSPLSLVVLLRSSRRRSVSWKGRHFVLRDESIAYFVKQGGGDSRGEIALTGASRVCAFPKRAHAFQVVTGSKSLTMCASTAEEQGAWQTAIESAIVKLGPSMPMAAMDEWQVVSAAGQDFEMSPKYEMIKPIGHGAYGVVISAIDHQNNTKVAIKKIPDTFEDLVDAKRIVREIHLLRSFDHDNVIRVVDLFTPQPHTDFNDVYIVSDLMETDMHRVIYSKQQLTAEHIQFFLYQMLCGLNYIHSCGVVHRDLKPSNVLLNAVSPNPPPPSRAQNVCCAHSISHSEFVPARLALKFAP